MKKFKLQSKQVFIIAEIGKNFIRMQADQPVSVYLANAKKLVDEAKRAGADAVKFQTHNVEDEQLNIKITSPHFNGADRFSWLTRNTLATPVDEFWRPLKIYCEQQGILFFSTPMSRGAAQILESLDMKLWKIGSGDILDFPMLDFIAGTKKPVILSSGMSTLAEVTRSVNFLKKRKVDLTLVHAISRYPCPPEEMNIKTMLLLKKKFKVPVGFSHNSPWPDLSLAAVALGARVIEQHFTLSRTDWGADHKVSMEPPEFKEMVQAIRKIENKPAQLAAYLRQVHIKKALGRPIKQLQKGESLFRPIFRKSLVAGAAIAKGQKLTANLIYAMRPQRYSAGLASENYEKVLGRIVKKDLKKFDPITKQVI